jgi:hypothetical protein
MIAEHLTKRGQIKPSLRPIHMQPSWPCRMRISRNVSPAPRPTAKPYGTDCARGAPIRCCRAHSNRVTRPKLPEFVLSLTRR